MLKKQIRYLSRYQDILSALYHYGFGHIVRDLGLLEKARIRKKKHKNADHSMAKRIRLLLEELGPTFIKLGQLASTRKDLFPAHILAELAELQDNVAPFPFAEAKAIVEQELGAPLTSLFQSFSEEVLAAASIGQVHRATLLTGEETIVKVRRPQIERLIETDLAILSDLISVAEEKIEWVRRLRLTELFAEFAAALKNEIDYKLEAQHAERIRRQSSTTLSVPKNFPHYCTSKVLTQAFVEGRKMTEAVTSEGFDQTALVKRFATGIFEQIFVHGFFHGDPHPGNVFVTKDSKIVLIDFGMVGRLSTSLRQNLAFMMIGLKSRDTERVMNALLQMDIIHEQVNHERLKEDLDDLRLKYYDLPLSDISLGEAIQDMFNVAHKHQCIVPPDLMILGKTILSVEAIVATMAPNLSIMDLVEPFGRMLIHERFHPKHFFQKAKDTITEPIRALQWLPTELHKSLSTIRRGQLKVTVSMKDMRELLQRVDRISNKLAFSLVLLAFSIIMAAVIIGTALTAEQTVLSNIPAVEIGLTMTALMFFAIIWSIFRSGRF
ncbi:ABC1 kinase family protein [Shouchella lonarensis]|uniref:2-octaprenylphenol hydroxylase n=1 Tax=Shouchella lonarensis TaxID=1464122 RepID=A0A1G6LDM9_9BACI|nr:AarF/ABC1/UbiB kinase family protein [Shouchella lonarensis]SDC40885.1 2-octaprenylphenol hydroxylase [Shouchella lonarensis]